MDRKTFLQLEKGDILYTVTIKDSKLVNGAEINVVKVKSAEKSEDFPYMMQVELEGQDAPILLNWNCCTTSIPLRKNSANKNKYVEGFNFIVLSTDPRDCREHIINLNKDAINKLGTRELELSRESDEIHQEVVKLSGIKILAEMLKLKKVEEVVTEVEYV